ncbi:hypothetical protein K439DRAFT_1176344 [Ramaria rubella]|nr:hypothetical protein K439DRAFT_1176344 [Ramaria rubella]
MVEIMASCLVETYTCSDAEARIKHLEAIYAPLRHRHVPNTDHIILAKGKALSLLLAASQFLPKSRRTCESVSFVFWMRWSCFMRSQSFTEIYATPPTKGEPRFSTSDHSPRIRDDNHGAEVDIWGVGHLITSSTAADLSGEFKALGKRVCEEAHILTAQEVLELVKLVPCSRTRGR